MTVKFTKEQNIAICKAIKSNLNGRAWLHCDGDVFVDECETFEDLENVATGKMDYDTTATVTIQLQDDEGRVLWQWDEDFVTDEECNYIGYEPKERYY